MNIVQANKVCNDFAIKHKVIFEDVGEVGIGRECVGFTKGNGYIDYNPFSGDEYKPIEKYAMGEKMYAPVGVESYHKHDCLCVLGRGNEAIIGLALWVEDLNKLNNIRVEEYAKGHTGMQAMLSGSIGYTLTYDKVKVIKPTITLTKAEIQSGLNRVKWAEGLILQLPSGHEGKNSWLLNYGTGEEAVQLRLKRNIKWMDDTDSAETVN